MPNVLFFVKDKAMEFIIHVVSILGINDAGDALEVNDAGDTLEL